MLNVGTSIFKCDIIPVLIFRDFFVDLSIIEAKPKSFAFAFFINLTHSKLDFPVVITSSIIMTYDPFLILNPLLKVNFPLTLSQKIVSFFNNRPISYPMIIPPIAGAKIKLKFLKFFFIFEAKDLQICSALEG